MAEYADILGKDRNQAQVELATVRAELIKVKTELDKLKKAQEKPKEEAK